MNWNEYVELCKFSPPYGDGTIIMSIFKKEMSFSPPYGDGTRFCKNSLTGQEFSPPYGDGTLENSVNYTDY